MSLMLELRRDAYLLDEGCPDDAAIDPFAAVAADLLDAWTPPVDGR